MNFFIEASVYFYAFDITVLFHYSLKYTSTTVNEKIEIELSETGEKISTLNMFYLNLETILEITVLIVVKTKAVKTPIVISA